MPDAPPALVAAITPGGAGTGPGAGGAGGAGGAIVEAAADRPSVRQVKLEELPGELGQRYEMVSRIPLNAPGVLLRVKPRGVAREYALEWGLAIGGDSAARPGRSGLPTEWTGTLAHENLLVPVSAGILGEHRYVVTPIPQGQTLAELLATPGTLALDRVIEIAFQLARALAHMHKHGLIHRDVKPQSIILEPGGRLRLAGLSGATSSGSSGGDYVPGTPAYMPPEQARGVPGAPSGDVYGFGCVLYEMLTGRRPGKRRSVRGLLADAQEVDPTPVRDLRPGVPPALEKLTSRCLARGPAMRPLDGGKLIQELALAAREIGQPEPVDLSFVDAQSRATAVATRPSLPLVSVTLPGACLLGSCMLLALAQWLWGEPEGRALGGASLVGALAILARALSAFARRTTGDSDAWWRVYLVDDPVEGIGQAARQIVPIVALLCVIGALAIVRASPLLLWLALAVAGAPGTLRCATRMLRRAAPRLAGPLAQGQSELLVDGDGEGWMHRSAGAQSESLLPRRLWLPPGLVRVELWRPGGRRRTFLLYAPEKASHLIARVVERDDGPAMVQGREQGKAQSP